MTTPAYGFMDLVHLADQRTTDVGVEVISQAIEQSVQEHNRQINALISLFAERTTAFKRKFKTSVVTRNQPLDDQGRARPIQPTGTYEVAWPLMSSGNAWGADYRTRKKMTVQEASDATNTLLDGDMRWVRDQLLAALFANTSWTFSDELNGNLTIEGLANGDGTEYHIAEGADSAADDTHYGAQAAAISDTDDPFETIYEDVIEHPENGGEVVALIPTNLRSAVVGLTEYNPVRDPNMQYGTGTDLYVGELGIPLPGKLIGYHEAGVHIVHWRSMPSGYIAVTTTEGARALRMREEPEADLQGFHIADERKDYPYWEQQYIRYAGFGAWNRVGAYVYRVGNASYAVPTGYGCPLA